MANETARHFQEKRALLLPELPRGNLAEREDESRFFAQWQTGELAGYPELCPGRR